MVTKVKTQSAAAPSSKKATVIEDSAAPDSFSFTESLHGLFEQFELPSGKRVLISFIVGILAGGVTAYLGATLTMYLTVGAALLTGSAFIAFMVMFIGYALSILATAALAGKVQSFILSGDIDRCYQKVSSRVVGWFGASKDFVTAKVAS